MIKRIIAVFILMLIAAAVASARPRSVQLVWTPVVEPSFKIVFVAPNCATAILTIRIESDVVVDSTWYRTMLVRAQGLMLTPAQADTIKKMLISGDFPTTKDMRICRYLGRHWFMVTEPDRTWETRVRMAKPDTKMSSSGRWQEAQRKE